MQDRGKAQQMRKWEWVQSDLDVFIMQPFNAAYHCSLCIGMQI